MSGSGLVQIGGLAEWLRGAEALLHSPEAGVDVACGSCRGCCRSSMLIHIAPDETETLRRIPRELVFDAPDMPEGHLLMGYDELGQCPMLVDGNCSIYEHRPHTCRKYDCRVFAATGIAVDQSQPEIAQRVGEWRFSKDTPEDRAVQKALYEAAAFLDENRESFPSYAGARAAIAVRIHHLFFDGRPTLTAVLQHLEG